MSPPVWPPGHSSPKTTPADSAACIFQYPAAIDHVRVASKSHRAPRIADGVRAGMEGILGVPVRTDGARSVSARRRHGWTWLWAGLTAALLVLPGVGTAFAQVAEEVDLLMEKSAPAAAAADTDIVYSLTVTNLGPDAAASAAVTDPLPADVTFVSLPNPAGWTCTTPVPGSGGTVSCTNPSFAAGDSTNFTLTVHIAPATTPGTFITNVATASTATFDPTSENDSATASTLVTGGTSADLSIVKSAPATVQPDQDITYTLTVINVGPDAAANVTVTDPLPGNLTFVSQSAPAGWTCVPLTVGAAGQTMSCSIASLAALAGGTFTLVGHVPSGTADGTTYDNIATISSTTSDPLPENNSSTAGTTVVAAAPDLAIAKSHSGNAVQGQTGFTYTITVSNVGTVPSSGTVTMQDVLPAGMTATALSGIGWSCNVGTLTCDRADALAAASSYPVITLTVNVAADAAPVVVNTATVANAGDTNPANDTAVDVTNVSPAAAGPDLTIAKTHSGNAKQGQTGFVYTITVRNVGAAATTGTVTVTDTLPPSMTATAISGSGWSCVVSATPTCTRSDALAAGGTYPVITLTVTVAGDAPASVTNTATVSGGGDVNPANNTASDATTVVSRRDPSQDPDVVGLINAQIAAAERFANAQMMNFNQRLETLHENGCGEDRQGIRVASNDRTTANAYVADGFSDLPGASSYADAKRPASPSKRLFDPVLKAEPTVRKAEPAAARCRDLSFWSSGYVNFGSANDVIPGSGFDFTTSGVSAGADYRLTPKLTAGLGLGYGRDRTRIGVNGTESRAETYSITAYESYRPWRHLFIDGLLGFGTLKFDSQRFVVDNSDFAFGSRTGAEWFGSLSAGYEYRTRHLLLSPYARLKAVWLTLDAFTETGDPTGSLAFARQSVETYTGVLGLRGKYDIPMDFAVVSPRFRLEYNHAFQNGGIAALGFADWIGGPTYFVPGVATTSDFATVGVGADVRFPNAMFVNFDYQTMINAFDTRSHMFQIKAGGRFSTR